MIALALPVVKKVRGSDKKKFQENWRKKNWKILEWAGPKLQDPSLQFNKDFLNMLICNCEQFFSILDVAKLLSAI